MLVWNEEAVHENGKPAKWNQQMWSHSHHLRWKNSFTLWALIDERRHTLSVSWWVGLAEEKTSWSSQGGSIHMCTDLVSGVGCSLQGREDERIITGACVYVLLGGEALFVWTRPSWRSWVCTPQCLQPSYTGHLCERKDIKHSFKRGCSKSSTGDHNRPVTSQSIVQTFCLYLKHHS